MLNHALDDLVYFCHPLYSMLFPRLLQLFEYGPLRVPTHYSAERLKHERVYECGDRLRYAMNFGGMVISGSVRLARRPVISHVSNILGDAA